MLKSLEVNEYLVKANLCTRYLFTSKLLCTSKSSLSCPFPSALPTLVQYYCTTIGQYTTPPPTSRMSAIHYTIMVITISCKGQRVGGGVNPGPSVGRCPAVYAMSYFSLSLSVSLYHYIYTHTYIYIYI